MALESKDYESILNSMPETGIYVIREDDHNLLYFNERVRTLSPQAHVGMACREVWAGSCANCPLRTIQDRQMSRSLSYNAAFGGVVDMVATRMLWQDTIPALVVSVTPRIEAAGYTYRKILYLNLTDNRYEVVKSDGGPWFAGSGTKDFTAEFRNLAQSNLVHPEDARRLASFIDIKHLQNALRSGRPMLTCIFRRRQKDGFRWNLAEVVPAFDYSDENQTAMLCVKDVHDAMREGLEREEDARNRDALMAVGEQSFGFYAIDIDTGAVDPIRVDEQMPSEQLDFSSWDVLISSQLMEQVHPAYRDAFAEKFSLAGLTHAKEAGEQEIALLCQWKRGDTYRYISVIAYLGRERVTSTRIVISFEDMDEQIRREVTHSQHDMQIAAILKSRFTVITSVNLENGQCERIYLDRTSEPKSTSIGDYNYFVQQALLHYVHTDDRENYLHYLSMEHLRETAAETESYREEICQYRTRGESVHWIEQHVIYSLQDGKMTVNILGQDITREKSREGERLKSLQDRAYIIGSLSSLFFSTYYIDLEKDTFRIVTQLGKMGDVLGNEVSYSAALRIHAEHFIHPDDREEYLRVMNTPHLLENLRWWQPCVTVTYRKLSEEGVGDTGVYKWVLATAVLAQIGEDDIPVTAVYVAQDITDARQRQML